jgi:hypothetical protein
MAIQRKSGARTGNTGRITCEAAGHRSSTTLDDYTAAWVMEVANIAHTQPASLIASIIGDVAREDRLAHDAEPASRSSAAVMI